MDPNSMLSDEEKRHIGRLRHSSPDIIDPQYNAIRKDEILRQLFGDVGDLIDDYSCAVESSVLLHGRMYVTAKFLCFYSNIFGLEKKLRIPFHHIQLISKVNTVMVIPNAISITTARKGMIREYLFRSFWDRDESYRVLKDVLETSRRLPHTSSSSLSSKSGVPRPAGSGKKPHSLEDVYSDNGLYSSRSSGINNDELMLELDVDITTPRTTYRNIPRSTEMVQSTYLIPTDTTTTSTAITPLEQNMEGIARPPPIITTNVPNTTTTSIATTTSNGGGGIGVPRSSPPLLGVINSSTSTSSSTPPTRDVVQIPLIPSSSSSITPFSDINNNNHNHMNQPVTTTTTSTAVITGGGEELSDDDDIEESEVIVSSKRLLGSTGTDPHNLKELDQMTSFTTSAVLSPVTGDPTAEYEAQGALYREEITRSKLKLDKLTESLPVNIIEYFCLFLDDDAPYGYPSFYESRGNYDMNKSSWSSMSAYLGYSREMKFIKPLSYPGISSTRCTNVQRHRFFGGYGMVLCSSTRMEDVPAAHTFTVEDMICIRSIEEDIPHTSRSIASTTSTNNNNNDNNNSNNNNNNNNNNTTTRPPSGSFNTHMSITTTTTSSNNSNSNSNGINPLHNSDSSQLNNSTVNSRKNISRAMKHLSDNLRKSFIKNSRSSTALDELVNSNNRTNTTMEHTDMMITRSYDSSMTTDNNNNNNNNIRYLSDKISIDFSLEVKFIKSTMFKSMIESSTEVEVTKFIKDYYQFLKTKCEEYKVNPDPIIKQKVINKANEMNLYIRSPVLSLQSPTTSFAENVLTSPIFRPLRRLSEQILSPQRVYNNVNKSPIPVSQDTLKDNQNISTSMTVIYMLGEGLQNVSEIISDVLINNSTTVLLLISICINIYLLYKYMEIQTLLKDIHEQIRVLRHEMNLLKS